jgi:hypothetical protein
MRIMLFFAVLMLVHANISHAALGGPPEKFYTADAKILTGVSTPAANYVRRETTLPSGTVVREYISATGTVFAVAWAGPFMPDLKSLLGVHFDTLVAEAAKTSAASRSSVIINRPDVVIRSGGRMGAFQGSAWIPAALPAGFSADDVR